MPSLTQTLRALGIQDGNKAYSQYIKYYRRNKILQVRAQRLKNE